MAGRGRLATLPAWMTSGNGTVETSAPVAPTNPQESMNKQASIPAPAPPRVPPPVIPPLSSMPPKMPPLMPPRMPPQMPPQFNNLTPNGMGQPPMFMGGNPNVMPGMPMMPPPGAFGGFPPPMQGFPPTAGFPAPGGFPPAFAPMGAAAPQKQQSAPVIGDPNNDVSCWSEHESGEGRKYWYNRVSLVSTYEKPFCLKTPEERSIPPCPWKEYTADGKTYYSNGTESTWTMPEEYKKWKEQIDAIEKKKLIQQSQPLPVPQPKAVDTPPVKTPTTKAVVPEVPKIVYANQAEAVEAFKSLLEDQRVSTLAKMKEVVELCQGDPRWFALNSNGEKKQALAEYQTKKLKQEKEIQKAKARKHRDAFLLMLAENTDIDARTRWRDAMEILQEDHRYKNVEDARDREDLFKDFILELEKKEKEDRRKAKDAAFAYFTSVLENMKETGVIDRKSIWGDSKKDFVDIIVKPELRALDDIDLRRCFQDFIGQLEEEYRKAERKKKEDFQRLLDERLEAVKQLLEGMVSKGAITPETRWRDLSGLDEVIGTEEYKGLLAVFNGLEDPEEIEKVTQSSCREVFDKVLLTVVDEYRVYKKLIKEVMSENKLRISHKTTQDEVKVLLLKAGKLVETEVDGKRTITVDTLNTEEGEELDISPTNTSNIRDRVKLIRTLLLQRFVVFEDLFEEMREKAVKDHEEDLRLKKKAEDKFLGLLQEYFYLSDHVSVTWEEAKKKIHRRSAYDAVDKPERKRLFAKYMEELNAKMDLKKKSMESMFGEHKETSKEDAEKGKTDSMFDEYGSDDSHDDDDDEDKEKRKKHKKSKKHKKHKRDRSASSSPSPESRKKKSKK